MKRRDLLLTGGALLGSLAAGGFGGVYLLGGEAAAKAQALKAEAGHGTGAADGQPPAPPSAATKAEPQAAAGANGAPAMKALSGDVPFDYEGAQGPSAWGELAPGTAVCRQGGAQSPVDITNPALLPSLKPLSAAYGTTRLRVAHNGHTVQVTCDPGSALTFNGRSHELVQFHFHTPSEHTLDGRHFPMELHLVHRHPDGGLTVLGVMLLEGRAHPFLDRFWSRLPKAKGELETGLVVSLAELLPGGQALAGDITTRSPNARPTPVDPGPYFTYAGSLTTPPCSENVTWLLLRRSAEVSPEQVAAFKAIFPRNARPVQPIGPRTILQSP